MNDLYSIASELVTERKMLLESLKRLESAVRIPVDTAAHHSVAALHESIGRVGGLVRAILQITDSNEEIELGRVLRSIGAQLKTLGSKFGKTVEVDFADPAQLRVDAKILETISKPLSDLFSLSVEFGVESDKERELRKKKIKTVFKVTAVPASAGIILTIAFDGNGVTPPVSRELSEQLGAAGMRVEFQGRPALWSIWRVVFSTNRRTFKCIRGLIDGVEIAIPHWAISSVGEASKLGASTLIYSMKRDWTLHKSPNDLKHKTIVTVGAGLSKICMLLDEMRGADEVLVRYLPQSLLSGGRVMGLAVWSGAGATSVKLLPVVDPNWLAHARSA